MGRKAAGNGKTMEVTATDAVALAGIIIFFYCRLFYSDNQNFGTINFFVKKRVD